MGDKAAMILRYFKAMLVGLVALAALPMAAIAAPSPILLSEFIDPAPPYPQAHASTIVELPDGTLAAAWFGGTGESRPDVTIWFARRGAHGWDRPVAVADGQSADRTRYPTWNPVLFQPPGAPLTLFYKVGPNPRGWWGMVKISSDGGRSWSAAQRLPEGVLGPIKNKPVVLADGSWLSPSSREEGTPEHNRWCIRMERSTDQGRSWTVEPPIASPMGIEAIQPSVLHFADGRLAVVARTRQGALAMSWSRDTGKSWSPLAAIDLPNPNAGTDAVTLADGRQLIVYNHSAHWPDHPGEGPRWPLNIGLSRDGGDWRNVLTLEDKPLPDGYAYPAVIQTRDGLVHISYTYNRTHIRHVVVDPARLGG
ncbi:sialidase family protein [Sphingomonas echinoides]|uniref:Sialidase family protein n=1 Tax=Sphingomonas echinoides TaxID=59803 RepID=A0ABU4PU12_9SPHN|nr:sialidase family protein [Sphingomonas echinoides]MDX5985425.1 sialidase family protein [Sphingomonas echinoides]